MLRRKFVAVLSVSGVLGCFHLPQVEARAPTASEGDISLDEALTRRSAKDLAVLLRPDDGCDWHLNRVEAAFLPVVHRARVSGGLVTAEALMESVKRLDTVIADSEDETLPAELRASMVRVLETIPGVDLTRRRQPQTSHDQFGYTTMHVQLLLNALQHAGPDIGRRIVESRVNWKTVMASYYASHRTV